MTSVHLSRPPKLLPITIQTHKQTNTHKHTHNKLTVVVALLQVMEDAAKEIFSLITAKVAHFFHTIFTTLQHLHSQLTHHLRGKMETAEKTMTAYKLSPDLPDPYYEK